MNNLLNAFLCILFVAMCFAMLIFLYTLEPIILCVVGGLIVLGMIGITMGSGNE